MMPTGESLQRKPASGRPTAKAKIGCVNVRKMGPESDTYNLDICGLSETKREGSGRRRMGDYEGFYSRVEESEETNGGVAVAVRRHHKRVLKAWGAVNERIIWVKFSSRNVTKMIVSCYAPTEEQKESFYVQLQAIM
ncbi:craniofacial development 2-like [Brachionus plicatilis]|uniref:Craniofacial development 2-like n=1 Tax=Brachionus plicatilis TaxID=10195 RepID=A0A3M7REG8_BRAPC|nr:craniofacial development 2-like [Brachionus plicatilis]